MIAAGQGSDAPTELCLAQMAAIAHRVEMLLRFEGITEPQTMPLETIVVLNRVLFQEEGFSGNRDNYYEIENSYLDKVLARRTGIPITLSILYMEIARQVGLPLQGIGLPGHFVVGFWSPFGKRMPALVVDPFDDGKLLSPDDCAAMVHAAYGEDVRFTPDWMQPMSNRQILARVLNNLKHIFVSMAQDRDALRIIDMILAVQPDAIWELKERGMIYYRMGAFVLALADLRRYAKLTPENEDNYLVHYYIEFLQRMVVSNN